MKSKPGEVVSSPKLTLSLHSYVSQGKGWQGWLPSLFGLEGFSHNASRRPESLACAPVRGGGRPATLPTDKRTSQGGGVTSPEQIPLEIKQKVNIETPMFPLDGANSYLF